MKRLPKSQLKKLIAEFGIVTNQSHPTDKNTLVKSILDHSMMPTQSGGSDLAKLNDTVLAQLFESLSNSDIIQLLKTDEELANRFNTPIRDTGTNYPAEQDPRALPLTRMVVANRFREAMLRRGVDVPLRDLTRDILTIIVEQNQELGTFPAEIGLLSHLKVLNLFQNGIYRLPDEIGDLSQLRSLDLTQNPLNSLPRALIRLKNLKRLNLRGTGLMHERLNYTIDPMTQEILDRLTQQGVTIMW